MPLLSGPITGPKAFAIFASFFVVIIAVNVTLAVQAVRTFPGLEVENSYVASQLWDRERATQEALGWTVRAEAAPDGVGITILGPDGRPVTGATITAEIGRPTDRIDDQTLALAFDGAAWAAPATLGPGRWQLRLRATAADGTPFRQDLALRVEARP